MTEHFFEGSAENDLHRGLINAKEIHELFTVGEVNAYFYWWLFAAAEKGEAACLVRLREADGKTGAGEFTPYRTSATEQLKPLPAINAGEGQVAFTLPARSITTLVTASTPAANDR